MIKELIRAWGVKKFMEATISALRRMGANENWLASELDILLSKYLDRT